MNKAVLEAKIRDLGIPPSTYSLTGELITGIVLDTLVDGSGYNVFILDERSNYHEEKKFTQIEAAYDYVYQLILVLEKLLSDEIKDRYKSIYRN